MEEVVLTGLRTNGEYHLGNYIGALLPMLQLVEKKRAGGNYRINLFAPDLHSFTTPIDHSGLYQQTMANLRLFAAAGLPLDDPAVSLYRQSRIPAHSELTWILSNFAGFGDLSRMVEFKEKTAALGGEERIGVGLFTYPILMAADILLYDAKWVPVGDDQRQHLEFCRRLARSFNQQFDTDIFTVPADFAKQQTWLGREVAPRIRSLRRPDKKMSKSVEDPSGTIMLSDPAELAEKKIMAAETDNFASVDYDWESRPGITNLLAILAALSGRPQAEINQEWQGSSDYRALKAAVAAAVAATLEQLQNSLSDVSETTLDEHLSEREARLAEIAKSKLAAVQRLVGLRE